MILLLFIFLIKSESEHSSYSSTFSDEMFKILFESDVDGSEYIEGEVGKGTSGKVGYINTEKEMNGKVEEAFNTETNISIPEVVISMDDERIEEYLENGVQKICIKENFEEIDQSGERKCFEVDVNINIKDGQNRDDGNKSDMRNLMVKGMESIPDIIPDRGSEEGKVGENEDSEYLTPREQMKEISSIKTPGESKDEREGHVDDSSSPASKYVSRETPKDLTHEVTEQDGTRSTVSKNISPKSFMETENENKRQDLPKTHTSEMSITKTSSETDIENLVYLTPISPAEESLSTKSSYESDYQTPVDESAKTARNEIQSTKSFDESDYQTPVDESAKTDLNEIQSTKSFDESNYQTPVDESAKTDLNEIQSTKSSYESDYQSLDQYTVRSQMSEYSSFDISIESEFETKDQYTSNSKDTEYISLDAISESNTGGSFCLTPKSPTSQSSSTGTLNESDIETTDFLTPRSPTSQSSSTETPSGSDIETTGFLTPRSPTNQSSSTETPSESDIQATGFLTPRSPTSQIFSSKSKTPSSLVNRNFRNPRRFKTKYRNKIRSKLQIPRFKSIHISTNTPINSTPNHGSFVTSEDTIKTPFDLNKAINFTSAFENILDGKAISTEQIGIIEDEIEGENEIENKDGNESKVKSKEEDENDGENEIENKDGNESKLKNQEEDEIEGENEIENKDGNDSKVKSKEEDGKKEEVEGESKVVVKDTNEIEGEGEIEDEGGNEGDSTDIEDEDTLCESVDYLTCNDLSHEDGSDFSIYLSALSSSENPSVKIIRNEQLNKSLESTFESTSDSIIEITSESKEKEESFVTEEMKEKRKQRKDRKALREIEEDIKIFKELLSGDEFSDREEFESVSSENLNPFVRNYEILKQRAERKNRILKNPKPIPLPGESTESESEISCESNSEFLSCTSGSERSKKVEKGKKIVEVVLTSPDDIKKTDNYWVKAFKKIKEKYINFCSLPAFFLKKGICFFKSTPNDSGEATNEASEINSEFDEVNSDSSETKIVSRRDVLNFLNRNCEDKDLRKILEKEEYFITIKNIFKKEILRNKKISNEFFLSKLEHVFKDINNFIVNDQFYSVQETVCSSSEVTSEYESCRSQFKDRIDSEEISEFFCNLGTNSTNYDPKPNDNSSNEVEPVKKDNVGKYLKVSAFCTFILSLIGSGLYFVL